MAFACGLRMRTTGAQYDHVLMKRILIRKEY